ncbi:type I toxin-antitoxin system Fst family toxin [Staphylococcus capitis]
MTREGGAYMLFDIFVHIMATATSGCIVALFAHWLSTRNDKRK